jgi:hypothetical protein
MVTCTEHALSPFQGILIVPLNVVLHHIAAS